MGHSHRNIEELDEAVLLLRRNVTAFSPVFTLRSAERAGTARSVIRSLVTSNRIRRIRHGAYVEECTWKSAQADPPLMRRLIVTAAIVGLREPAYAYGQIAAELHGLPLEGVSPTVLELVRDRGHDVRSANSRVKDRNRLEGVRIISRDLTNEMTTTQGGIPVVSLASAAVTAAAQFRREYCVGGLDAALNRGASHEDLAGVITRWQAGKGVTGTAGLIDLARPGAESVLESVSRVRLMDRGIPEPLLQHVFSDARGFVGRVDMWWPELNVVGEADGLEKYQHIRDVQAEKLREDRLRNLGLTVVRWTWDEIWSTPRDVVRRIERARHRHAA